MTIAQRSAAMAKIKGNNTAPERWVRNVLWHAGFRYRLHSKALPGRPDLVLARWDAAILVHGCFWHHHDDCPLFRIPATRPEFWIPKLEANAARDRRVVSSLTEAGWRSLVIWECAIRFAPLASAELMVSWLSDWRPSAQLEWRVSGVAEQSMAHVGTFP